jgi:hypothetical protein
VSFMQLPCLTQADKLAGLLLYTPSPTYDVIQNGTVRSTPDHWNATTQPSLLGTSACQRRFGTHAEPTMSRVGEQETT